MNWNKDYLLRPQVHSEPKVSLCWPITKPDPVTSKAKICNYNSDTMSKTLDCRHGHILGISWNMILLYSH